MWGPPSHFGGEEKTFLSLYYSNVSPLFLLLFFPYIFSAPSSLSSSLLRVEILTPFVSERKKKKLRLLVKKDFFLLLLFHVCVCTVSMALSYFIPPLFLLLLQFVEYTSTLLWTYSWVENVDFIMNFCYASRSFMDSLVSLFRSNPFHFISTFFFVFF